MKLYKTKIENCFYFYMTKYMDLRGTTNILDLEFDLKNKTIFRPNQLILTESKKNVFRGFHYQKKIPQEKLVTLIMGKIDDFIIDLRKNSNTYKKIIKINLQSNDRKFIYIPKGCAHGFYTKAKKNKILYLIKGKYKHELQSGINLLDPTFKNFTKSFRKLIMSKKDKQLPFLAN